LQDLIYVIMFALVTTGFLLFTLGLSRLLRPSARTEEKLLPYECGMDQQTRPWARVHVRYYFFGLLFVLFDVETVLLFAVATQFRAMRAEWAFTAGTVGLFTAMVLGALAYAWRRGALRWQ
jgi:NADH-quinone oxidoreductase subunit A